MYTRKCEGWAEGRAVLYSSLIITKIYIITSPIFVLHLKPVVYINDDGVLKNADHKTVEIKSAMLGQPTCKHFFLSVHSPLPVLQVSHALIIV